jgi:hypothetical protein
MLMELYLSLANSSFLFSERHLSPGELQLLVLGTEEGSFPGFFETSFFCNNTFIKLFSPKVDVRGDKALKQAFGRVFLFLYLKNIFFKNMYLQQTFFLL